MDKNYGTIIFNKTTNEWILDKIEPHVVIKLKSLFPKIEKTAINPFKLKDSLEVSADLYWIFQRYSLKISKKDLLLLKDKSKNYHKNISNMENILVNKSYSLDSNLNIKDNIVIRPYQSQIAKILNLNKTLICGDDLGLGKTYSGIASILFNKKLPAAIVVQTHLTTQWLNKINEVSHLKTHIIKSRTPYTLPDADVYIFKYSILSGWTNIIETGLFKTVVYDEIQELRAGKATQKGQVSALLSKKADYNLGLSATPIYNYGDEIWNIYNILDENALGDRESFLREWATFGGSKIIINDPKALGSYLRERFLLVRRTKHDVGQDLEPVNKLVYKVEYDENAVKDCMEIAKVLAMKTLNGSFIEKGSAARELDLMLRQYTGVSKAKYVAEFVKVFLDNNEPIILVGWHRDVYDIWLKELKDYKPLMYTGSETTAQKQKNLNSYINGESNLLILSLRSGAGIDGLQKRSSIMVFGELDWSPQVHAQAIGRLYREGQTEKVMAIFLVSDFGSDPLIMDILGQKNNQSETIMNPTDTIDINPPTDESRIKLLAKKILETKN